MLTIALPKRQREVLTESQARFVAAYVADPRRDPATAAAAAGYSAKSAKALGYALLRKPHVRRACALRESGAVTEEDAKRPLTRAEAVEVLNTIARTGAASQRLAALRMLGEWGGWEKPPAEPNRFAQSILAHDEERARAELAHDDSRVRAGRPCDSPADAGVEDDLD